MIRDKLADVAERISEHLTEISELFVPGTKLTLLARQPSHPDGSRDLVQTNDDLPSAIAALTIRSRAGRARSEESDCNG